ncbi:MAG: peptidoglycan DD-metalloendopeptidase family protein, partial [Bacteroidetes bacterium]|nr:peptidoglycan DD-metalloendopeptidase family protein [Bacteroidota bacterium]
MISVTKKMLKVNSILIVAAAFLIGNTLHAQSSGNIKDKIYDRGEELEDLRTTIEDLKQELKQKKSTEVNVLQQIGQLGKKLDFTNRLIARLEQEIEIRNVKVTESRVVVKASKNHIVKLKTRFAKRAVKMYKTGTYSDFELLLTSASVSQFFYRLKYMKLINDYDRKLYSSISSAIRNLNEKENLLLIEIREREKIIDENKNEKRNISENRNDRRKLLKKVQKDKGALTQLVKEKEIAAKQVEAIITALEDERKRLIELARIRKVPIEELTLDAEFASHKGKLIWPVVGRVTAKFGRRRQPQLKTITQNSGIDISAKDGAEVVSVLRGRITSITWIRGFGNTLIIDHGNGYYSVYTHLSEIFVTPTETVSTGQKIALVGVTGSLEG